MTTLKMDQVSAPKQFGLEWLAAHKEASPGSPAFVVAEGESSVVLEIPSDDVWDFMMAAERWGRVNNCQPANI